MKRVWFGAMIDGVAVVNTYVPQGRAIDHVMYKYKLGWYARLKRHVRDGVCCGAEARLDRGYQYCGGAD